jgi:DNA-binding MarR family transcriptional regulator
MNGSRADPVDDENAVADATDELLRAATVIRRGATSFAARARTERGGALSLNQTAVLGLLTKNPAMTPTEIAEKLHSSPQSLTRTIAALDELGMISRATDPSDRRQSILSITRPGFQAIRNEMRPRDVWLAGVIERELTDSERDILVVAARLLERLSEVDASAARIEP